MTRNRPHWLIALILTFCNAAMVTALLLAPSRQQQLQQAGILLMPAGTSLPAVSLQDTEGHPQRLDQLTGRWTLIFLGFTFCPDVCPTTLMQLRQIYRALPQQTRDRLRIVMISVDPKRDTPERLQQYIRYFDPSFQAYTGPLPDLHIVSNALALPFVQGDTNQPYYSVDHSGNLALIGPDGRQQGFLKAPLNNSQLIRWLPTVIH